MLGKVYLIGAGPGDPGLLTVKGLNRLREADVVVYDRLVDRRLLAEVRKEAELVYVGKCAGDRATDQDEIAGYLVRRALDGCVVARLKGGDPFVFGRGGEEAQALARAGVPFEVVPGVSSAIAAPAYAGIPLTHRGISSSFTVLTGSEEPSKEASDVHWGELARSGGTLVVLMGWSSLEKITGNLIKEGMDSSTPVALIRWGTEPYQRTVIGTLETAAQRGREEGLSPPVVAVIGRVVDLRSEVRWFDSKPLFGKRVLVTRSRSQASALSRLLAEEGADAVEVPAIEIRPMDDYSPLDRAISSLRDYTWVVFTSVNGVEAFFSRLRTLGLDTRALGGIKVGAIGAATAASLERSGIVPEFVPPQYVSEAVVEAMAGLDLAGSRILLPRADIGRDDLPQGLVRLGAVVDQVHVYRTVTPEGSRERAHERLKDGGIDVVTFTSSSTVENLLGLLDGDSSALGESTIACIGPVTAATARERGLQVDIVAQEYTIGGLVRALREHFGSREVV